MGEKTVVREVDRGQAVRLAKIEARASRERHRSVLRREVLERKAELAKLRVSMTAREAASKHLARAAPAYMIAVVLCFLFVLAAGVLTDSQTPVIATLVTLLVTSTAQNLRSIVSGEGNDDDAHPVHHGGNEPKEPKEPKDAKPSRK
jgi:hypothetical protein